MPLQDQITRLVENAIRAVAQARYCRDFGLDEFPPELAGAFNREAVPPEIVITVNEAIEAVAPSLLDRIEQLEEALAGLQRVLLPVKMALAQNELDNERTPDEAVLFSFMGSGASDHVTVGEFRAAVDAADAASRARATLTQEKDRDNG